MTNPAQANPTILHALPGRLRVHLPDRSEAADELGRVRPHQAPIVRHDHTVMSTMATAQHPTTEHHKQAAERHAQGETAQAAEQAHHAQGHAIHAAQHGEEAAKSHATHESAKK
jgi:hypothetical protein